MQVKILCLHGMRDNAEIFSAQTGKSGPLKVYSYMTQSASDFTMLMSRHRIDS
jgi:hypothetical protein